MFLFWIVNKIVNKILITIFLYNFVNMNIESYISLLYRYQCVTVPGFAFFDWNQVSTMDWDQIFFPKKAIQCPFKTMMVY
jgi:hypothetical protein